MKINSIEIINIKGLSRLHHNSEIKPNKVNIFVAPNGFGKTSFGIAFKYLTNSKIELAEKHLHNGNIANLPIINIEIEENNAISVLTADNTKNDIHNIFDVFVINSQLKAAGTVQRYGGRTIPRFSLDIEPTVLIERIPSKNHFQYKLTILKKEFGVNSKILSNVDRIIHNPHLLRRILSDINLNELRLQRTLKPLNEFVESINQASGKKEIVIEYLDSVIEGFLNSNDEVNKLVEVINNFKFTGYESLSQSFLIAWQIVILFKDLSLTQIKQVFKFVDYIAYTEFAKRFVSDFNTTRFSIEPKVEKNKLVINWPKADQISNGQRDILNFVALLLKARLNFNKENQILVIDEVFDYLDDANLISFQYFITDLIDKANEANVNLFPILLTHLDPNYFNHFCFSDGKLKVFYLKDYQVNEGLNLHKIIYNREEPKIKDELDEYFFHFNPNQIDISEKFEAAGLVKEWGDTNKFHRKIYREVNNYLDEKLYEPIAVCFALRKVIEMKVYNLIANEEHQKSFLKVHGTKNKLHYAQSLGVDIPESFFLLGIIYNTSLHLYNGQNITNTLAFKLENLTIKNIINEICRN